MASLWHWAASTHAGREAQVLKGPWKWIMKGGAASVRDPTAGYAPVYCTGHADGSVRLWDAQVRHPACRGRPGLKVTSTAPALPALASLEALGTTA